MLSTFPPTFSADSFIGNPFSSFEPGFPPWEYPEPSPLLPPLFSLEPVTSNSGSNDSNRNESKTLTSGSDGSDKPNRNNLKNKRGCEVEERKRRRMISNRESARRSRMRKQSHLENMRSQANRLKTGNREQMNRLRVVVHQTQIFRRENEHLRAEAVMLRQRLWDIRQVLVVRQLQHLLNPTAMGMH